MELRHLRYFDAVADELHFGRAAQRLHISQPPLSIQIKDLERELGVRLLERTRRQVSLTRSGELFLRRARAILSDVESAAEEVRRVERGEVDRISIGYRSSFMLQTFAPILREFGQSFPNVEFKLAETGVGGQYEAVRDHRMDIGFVDAPAITYPVDDEKDQDHLTGIAVMRLRMAMAVPTGHPMAKRKQARLAEFASDRFVMPERESVPTVYDLQIGLCQRAAFSPRVVAYAHQLPETLAMVAAGAGVCFATETLIGSWPGMIQFIKLRESAFVTIFAIYRRDNDGKAVQAFVELLNKRGISNGLDGTTI